MLHPIVYLAPVFAAFEIWQLVMGERYLGIRQIERGEHPRELTLPEPKAFIWCVGIFAYWGWMLLLLFSPQGQIQALCLLAVSAAGFAARRTCSLKWVLVVMTFEGAIRIGMLVSLSGMIFRQL